MSHREHRGRKKKNVRRKMYSRFFSLEVKMNFKEKNVIIAQNYF